MSWHTRYLCARSIHSHKKRNPKNATRLSASLRYVSLRSGQTCVTQARTRGRVRIQAACETFDEIGLKSIRYLD